MAVENKRETCNRFLVEVFDEILRVEEDCLAPECGDLSLRELHLIDQVCRAVDEGRDNRATAIAAAQGVTAGTLTTALNQLEKKGYLERRRDESDRRAVRIFPTEKARLSTAAHARFHADMVDRALSQLSDEEAQTLVSALQGLTGFFRANYSKKETFS